jgi:ABC-type nitrate/sulfonate/bicarbonate transport system substrate-binding protein
MSAQYSKNLSLEKVSLNIGFIPLTDCAPLVVARKKGLFEKYGLEVTLSKETSWANIRDKLALGILDAAQMLAPMPLAMTLGLSGIKKPVVTAFSMGLNGNAITVSDSLFSRMNTVAPEHMQKRADNVKALKAVVEQNNREGKSLLTFAVVYPFSAHSYELRYWMASAGIDPDVDINLVVVPPPQMPGQLESGDIDGYCVGEPWNSIAVQSGIGHTLITKYEIWNNSPEKVLGVSEEWAVQYPNTHKALLKALLEASLWVDQSVNRIETASLLSRGIYVNAPEHVVRMSMSSMYQYSSGKLAESMPDFNVFHRYAANYPWRSHAEWFLLQMMRWGHIREAIDYRTVAEQVYRPDIFTAVATELGIAAPTGDHKLEGISATEHLEQGVTLGPDLFFDGAIFNPGKPADYLQQFEISSISEPVELLVKELQQQVLNTPAEETS